MTLEEHKMILFMFTRQRELLATIWEVLKSRGVAERNDIPAFAHAVSLEDLGKAEYLRLTVAEYWKAAKECQVKLPPEIEAIGKTASEWKR